MKFRDMLTSDINNSDIIIKGYSFDKGCSVGKGARFAPSKITSLSRFLPAVTKDGKSLNGFKVFLSEVEKPKDISDIYKSAMDIFSYNKKIFFLGGDHSISIGTEAAFHEFCKQKSKRPRIIHFDAHPDFCSFYNGSNLSHACVNARAIDKGFKYEDIVLVGMRGFEEEETLLFKKHPDLKGYTTQNLLERSASEVALEIAKLFSEDDLIYISFDIDIFDPSFAPGTGTPEAFGISPNYIIQILEVLFKNLNVFCMDIVEVSPKLDTKNNTTSWLSIKLMYEVFGYLKEKGE